MKPEEIKLMHPTFRYCKQEDFHSQPIWYFRNISVQHYRQAKSDCLYTAVHNTTDNTSVQQIIEKLHTIHLFNSSSTEV